MNCCLLKTQTRLSFLLWLVCAWVKRGKKNTYPNRTRYKLSINRPQVIGWNLQVNGHWQNCAGYAPSIHHTESLGKWSRKFRLKIAGILYYSTYFSALFFYCIRKIIYLISTVQDLGGYSSTLGYRVLPSGEIFLHQFIILLHILRPLFFNKKKEKRCI